MAKTLKQVNTQAPKAIEHKAPKIRFFNGEDQTVQMDLEGDFSRIFNEHVGKNVTAGIVNQIARLGSPGKNADECASNFVLSFLDAMKPKDAAEALLLTQMAATHQATMMLARRLNHVQNIPQQDAAERALNKLARSYAAQMDTLKRYRSKGQQTVRVERVTVESGGQAVVGNVEGGGRGRGEK